MVCLSATVIGKSAQKKRQMFQPNKLVCLGITALIELWHSLDEAHGGCRISSSHESFERASFVRFGSSWAELKQDAGFIPDKMEPPSLCLFLLLRLSNNGGHYKEAMPIPSEVHLLETTGSSSHPQQIPKTACSLLAFHYCNPTSA